jgi:DNA uptake protein ComE-like DNA-binding protein
MTDPVTWLKQTPVWVWCAFIPAVGGLAIAYAGRKTHTSEWIYYGLGISAGAIALGTYPIAALIWVAQIILALGLRQPFLRKTLPANSYIPFGDYQSAHLLAEVHGKIDINTCSKDEMIRRLGLPIVYANDIDLMRHDGYQFTHLEELSEIAGLPESYLAKLQSLVVFSYNINKEHHGSWRRLNAYSVPELTALGMQADIAERLVAERSERGDFRSVVEIKKRTGVSFRAYQSLM